MARIVFGLAVVLFVSARMVGGAYGADGFGGKTADAANPQRAAAALERAEAAIDRDEFAQAIAALSEAIQFEPSTAEYYILRGWCCIETEDLDQAFRDFNEAVRLAPKDDDALDGRKLVRMLRSADALTADDPKQGIQIADDTVQFDPTDAKAYANRAHLLRKDEQYHRAIADYSEALRLDPKELTYYRGRGWTWKCIGNLAAANADFDEAVRLAGEAIRADPKNASHYVTRGFIRALNDDYDAAIADYDEALRLNPNLDDAKEKRESAIENRETVRFLKETEQFLKDQKRAKPAAP